MTNGNAPLSTSKPSQKKPKVSAIRKVQDAVESDEDLLPPAWPKAGKGLYAQLPPEKEDFDLLEDDNDEESFSQFFVNHLGRQIIESVG